MNIKNAFLLIFVSGGSIIYEVTHEIWHHSADSLGLCQTQLSTNLNDTNNKFWDLIER
jgi:hypothetical protein